MNRERETALTQEQTEGRVVEKVTREAGRRVVVVISIPPDGGFGEVIDVIRQGQPQISEDRK